MLRIEAHLPPAHAAGAENLSIELTALGDFEASTLTTKIAAGDARDLQLPFPAGTKAVSARVGSSAQGFVGLGRAGTGGSIDVLLWRSGEPTELWPPPEAPFPGEALGVSFGVDARRRTLLVAGALVATADASRALTVSLATGRAEEVAEGMLPARAFASITPFGADAMLVAGGVDPTLSGGDLATSPPLASASIFLTKEARFDRARVIALAQPRTRHASVVLESGETLLVGGAGPGGIPLATLEVVSPHDTSARIAGLATLGSPRERPRALRLSDGRVFVGGGTISGATVGLLEWLTPDARSLTFVQGGLVLAESHSFAAMPGGGVLGVGVCVPKSVQICSGDVPKRSVVWLRRSGAIDVLPPLIFTPSSASLIDANDGTPWLHARAGSTTVFRRFDPWTGRFEEPAERPEQGPDADLPAPLGVDTGAFVWLERGLVGALRGFRHGVRGSFARDLAPLLFASRDQVVPGHFPGIFSDSGIEYSAAGLGLAGADAGAFVADTDYADVDLELTLTSGPPPAVLMGQTRVGGSECPWPSVEVADPGEVLTLRRRGSMAVLERKGASRSCAVEDGRVTLGLAAADSATFVRSFEIRRR